MFVLFKKFPFFRRLKVKISGENNRISPSFSEMGGGGGYTQKQESKFAGTRTQFRLGKIVWGDLI